MERKIKTRLEMYNVVYHAAFAYYWSDSMLTPEEVSVVANCFAVRQTWNKYNGIS